MLEKTKLDLWEKKMATNFDEYQKAAINIEKNAVVSAGAGSGKTTVLSERFLHLIQKENGCNVDEILTLTFTKKATVEMSARIYKILKEKAPEQASNFYKANIKTLDSYCASVAKLGAHLYGISPDFIQNDEAIKKQAIDEALPFILQHRDNAAIKALVNTKNYEQIASELLVYPILEESTICEPIDFDSSLLIQIEEIKNAWEKTSIQINDVVNQIPPLYNEYEGNHNTQFLNKLNELCIEGEIPGIVELTQEDILNSNYQTISQYTKLIQNISSVKPSGSAALQPIKDCVYKLRELVDILISICNYVYGIPLVKEIIPLLKEFQEKINKIKRTSGILTFKDIANMAVCILRDFPDIRKLEKEKYKAIMIDEFQDNNAQQRDLLFLLAEKPERMEKGIPTVDELCTEKLFFVGDEKQSIYIFRGADVSVFRSLSNDFKEGNLEMTTNYRSHPALIAAFNTIFGGNTYPPISQNNQQHPSVFFTEKDANTEQIPNYEAIYHTVTLPANSAKEIAESSNPQEIYKPRIHIALFNKNQEAEKGELAEEEAEAEWVALEIEKLIQEGKNPSDIAVLVRTAKSLQPLYERTFLRHSIPYNTEAIYGFFADGPINDMMNFLKLCAYPENKTAYAQVLRSPFSNLSINETLAILAMNKAPFEDGSEALLEGNSIEAYRNLKQFYKEFSELLLTETITNCVSELWYHAGYRYETMWNHTVEMYSKLYDILFELAHKADQENIGLAGFVDSLEAYKDEEISLDGMDIPLDQVSGVHILTIFKSKGLEYDTVFVVGSHRGTNKDKNDKAVFISKDFGVTFNTPGCEVFNSDKSNYFFKLVKEEHDLKLAAELRRIVYVALTRAKNELYITNGKYNPEKKDIEEYLPGHSKKVSTIAEVLGPIMTYYQLENNAEFAPFDFIEIPTLPRNSDNNSSKIKNTKTEKIRIINEILALNPYENAENTGKIIKKDQLSSKYVNPSKLHAQDDENTNVIQNRYKPIEGVEYPEISKYVEESIPKAEKKLCAQNPDYEPKPLFDFTDFGTIAHAYMEAAINNVPVRISNKNISGLDNNKQKIQRIHEICQEMTEKFKNSEIGKQAIRSTEYYAEYEFRSRVENKIIKGIIDLVFKNEDGTYTVLDYKTNQEENPEIYYNQLACYRQAIAQMLGVADATTIKCYLFYLRSGHQVDITEECGKVDLNEAVRNIE